jgi:tetrahydromethanopterin S-methyltransferase subunit F
MNEAPASADGRTLTVQLGGARVTGWAAGLLLALMLTAIIALVLF